MGNEAAILIRDIPRVLRDKYKSVLAKEGKSMKEELVNHMANVVEAGTSHYMSEKIEEDTTAV